jgi:hypothetical protein
LLTDALEEYEAEMIKRSAAKVKASSEAAKFLHSDIAISSGDVTRGGAAAAAAAAASPIRDGEDGNEQDS